MQGREKRLSLRGMGKDAQYRGMIQSRRWQLLRKSVLSCHPLCERCKARGEVTPATEVHHVTPVEYGVSRGDKERLMFDVMNLRALCHRCHVETHVEMGRSGKAATRRILGERLAEINARLYGETGGN